MSEASGIPYADSRILVKVIQLGDTFPEGLKKVYACIPCQISFTEEEGETCTVTDGSIERVIFAGNFRNNYIVKDAYYMAYLIGDQYVLDNQAAFLEAQ